MKKKKKKREEKLGGNFVFLYAADWSVRDHVIAPFVGVSYFAQGIVLCNLLIYVQGGDKPRDAIPKAAPTNNIVNDDDEDDRLRSSIDSLFPLRPLNNLFARLETILLPPPTLTSRYVSPSCCPPFLSLTLNPLPKLDHRRGPRGDNFFPLFFFFSFFLFLSSILSRLS